jgi:predicted glycoside hydrolase/deacetylase ChbG (UPF0249 family)
VKLRITKYLIVNADDFGLSSGVNRGIIHAHASGIVTSASLMVCGPAADEAAAYGRRHPTFSIGLHVDLGEWLYRNKTWQSIYQRVALDNLTAIEKEVASQVAIFRRLLRKSPTHLDSHQHVHRHTCVREVLLELSTRLGIPLRHHSPNIHYCGAFYGQTEEGRPRQHVLSRLGLCTILKALPAGCSELSCHPGLDHKLKSVYRIERAKELKVLCDPRIRETLMAEGIVLRSFAALAKRRIA